MKSRREKLTADEVQDRVAIGEPLPVFCPVCGSPVKRIRRRPIDRAVSVILTGTGPDGSMGIKRVKEKGGIIIVQDPKQAEYSDMPHNAIRTGLVDYILPISEIPTKINEYKNRLGTVEIDVESDDETRDSDEAALQQIFLRLRIRTGHDFSGYKRATILRRIERRMNVHGLSDLHEYAKFLHENNKEPEALLKDLLISVTNFFSRCAGI